MIKSLLVAVLMVGFLPTAAQGASSGTPVAERSPVAAHSNAGNAAVKPAAPVFRFAATRYNCSGSPENSTLDEFPAKRFSVTIRGTSTIVTSASGSAQLRCGTTAYGYRHLVGEGHDVEFKRYISQIVDSASTWEGVFAIGARAALGNPSQGYYTPSNDTFCFTSHQISYAKSSTLTVRYYTNVVFSDSNWRIITAYPSTTPKC